MKGLRKWLILVHRSLGIGLGLVFLLWFVSGVGMIYAGGMPELAGKVRLERMQLLDLSRVSVSPANAAAVARLPQPRRVTLVTVLDRPAYRIDDVTVFADTGERLSHLDSRQARMVAARYLGIKEDRLIDAGILTEADQWTFVLRRSLPLQNFAADDAAQTHVYVALRQAEVVLVTTRRSRLGAWFSAIPHWLYLQALRRHDRIWRYTVIGLSALGTLAVGCGLLLSLLQFRKRYRGLLRWHYITGAAFGVFALTWVFSGMLSMEPWFWAAGDGADDVAVALAGGPLDLAGFAELDAARWRGVLEGRAPKAITLLRIHGRPHFEVSAIPGPPLLLTAEPLVARRDDFPESSIIAAIELARPHAPIVESRRLVGSDAYYRATRTSTVTLRVKLGDRALTWLYIDPATLRLVASFSRRQRLQRWLYQGLHRLDLPILDRRPAVRRAVLAALSLGGAVLSVIGVALGWRRLAPGERRPPNAQTWTH